LGIVTHVAFQAYGVGVEAADLEQPRAAGVALGALHVAAAQAVGVVLE
jgi:hypothetical protein